MIGAIGAVSLLVGVYLVVTGVRGVESSEPAVKPAASKPPVRRPGDANVAKRTALAVVIGAAFWWMTGWPMAGASATAVSMVVPLVAQAQRDRDRQLARAEDLARWCEMVRDSVRAGAPLRQAFDATARPGLVGESLRIPVRLLSDRCEVMPVAQALRLFADDVADPVADQIVVSLIMVEEEGGKDFVPILNEIVETVRRGVSMRRRVETGRARTYAATRSTIGITIVLAVLMTTFASDFMTPFDSFVGQFWMAIVGALFTGAVWATIPLSRPEPEPRLLTSATVGVA